MHFLEIEKYIIVDFFLFLVKSNSMIEKKEVTNKKNIVGLERTPCRQVPNKKKM